MASDKPKTIHAQISWGTLWLAGWLFSIGFLRLTFWKGVLAVLVWPYLLGDHFSTLAP